MLGLMIEKTSAGERTRMSPKRASRIFPLSSVIALTASLWKIAMSSPAQMIWMTASAAASPMRNL